MSRYEYADAISAELLAHTSKDALASVVVSLLTCGGDHIGTADVDALLAAELDALYAAGLVPRRLPRKFPRPLGDLP